VRTAAGDALYVADEDHGVVRKISLPLDVNAPAPAISMPGLPAQVLALEGRVLVTVRSEGALPPGTGTERPSPPAGPGLLLILRPDPAAGLVETARIALPQDAWGIAVTPDESIALVTSAWTHKVSAVDLSTAKLRFTVDVPREPRAVVVHPDGRSAYVTHLVGANLTRIDDILGEPKVRSVALPPSPLRTPVGKRNSASLAYAAVLSPDGSRLFVPRHALGAIGPQAWFGAATLDVLLTRDDTPLAPMRREGPRVVPAREMFNDLSAGGSAPRVAPAPFVQPRAVAYRKTSQTLLVLSEGADTMVELDARALDPTMHVNAIHSLAQGRDKPIPMATGCGGPSGIALSEDEQTAWIFCRSTSTVLAWSFAWDGPRPYLRLADDLLPAEAALGRRIFHDATDSLTSGGLACAGCHPEGRDDGHVWHETTVVAFDGHPTFVSGPDNVPTTEPEHRGYPRQTPLLAGRVVAEGPYGWHAESPNLTHRLTQGFALHRWSDTGEYHVRRDLYDRAMALRAFLRQGLVPPPREQRELSLEEKRGQEVFLSAQAGCAGCHVPATDYSDREAYALFTQLPPSAGFAVDPEKKYKTPSLRSVGETAPYLHDGRFASLRALVEQNGNRMGRTSHLSGADKNALIAFLETL
jgi:mono/diheme cytochrome c family protein